MDLLDEIVKVGERSRRCAAVEIEVKGTATRSFRKGVLPKLDITLRLESKQRNPRPANVCGPDFGFVDGTSHVEKVRGNLALIVDCPAQAIRRERRS